MATPIIVPVHHTRTRDCIVVEGKKYCEDSDIESSEAVAILLGCILFGVMLWAIGRFFSRSSWDGWDMLRDFGLFWAWGFVGIGALGAIVAGTMAVLS
jgi:hypothetical protein